MEIGTDRDTQYDATSKFLIADDHEVVCISVAPSEQGTD